MKIRIWLIISFFGIGTFNVHADTNRVLLIQNEMDCIAQHETSGVSWADVCSMAGVSDERRAQIIDEQLSLLEGNAPAQTASVQIAPMPIAPPEHKVQRTWSTAFNDRVHTFSLNWQDYYYHYNAANTPFYFGRKNTGTWGGIDGQYTFRPPQGNFFNTPVFNYYNIDFLYATGKNDLVENLQRYQTDNSLVKTTLKNIPGYMFDLRALLGRDFIPLPYLRATPYTGFGVRYITDHGDGHTNTLDDTSLYIFQNRSDRYYYIPIGLTFDLAVKGGYELNLNMEYDYFIKGYERIDNANEDKFAVPLGGPPSQNLGFSQDLGYGLRSSLKLLKHLSLVDVYFQPYIRYWYLGKSKMSSGSEGGSNVTTIADKNSTVEVGSSLGVQF